MRSLQMSSSHKKRNKFDGDSNEASTATKRRDVILTWQTIQPIGSGLSNMGNTCFLNSVLQCLTYTPPLVHFLQTTSLHPTSCRGPFCALCEIRSHVKAALSHRGGVIGPSALVRGLRSVCRSFRPGRQEDAHEYLLHLLEAVHKCLLPPSVAKVPSMAAKAQSFVNHCFQGQLRSQIICSSCQHSSDKYDPFMDLSLEIRRADSLTKALQRFTAPDVLDGDNKYSCSACRGKVRAQKQLTISEAPPVLAVQLKRFGSVTGGVKIDKMVHYPMTMDLSPFLSLQQAPKQGIQKSSQPLMYSLYAVLVHAGWSTHSGHYFSFVRSPAQTWHAMDDSRVSQVSEKTVLGQKAYMLFYIQTESSLNSSSSRNGSHGRISLPSTTESPPEDSPSPPAPQPQPESTAKEETALKPTEVKVQNGHGSHTSKATEALTGGGQSHGTEEPVPPPTVSGRTEGEQSTALSDGSADEYYAWRAGKVWPPAPGALLNLLWTMPKSRRYYWAKMARGTRQGHKVQGAGEQETDPPEKQPPSINGVREVRFNEDAGETEGWKLSGGADIEAEEEEVETSDSDREQGGAEAEGGVPAEGEVAEKQNGVRVVKSRGTDAVRAMKKASGAGSIFGFKVPTWDSPDGEARPLLVEDRSLPGIQKRRYDHWDSELDKGRTKKVKSKVVGEEDQGVFPLENPFQGAIQRKSEGPVGKMASRKAAKVKRLEQRRSH